MSYVTIVVGDKSTGQILDQDSGFGEANPDLVFVPLTGAFAPGNLVWVSDDDSPGELGTIEAIVADVHLDLVANLAHHYTMAQNAKVVLARNISNDAIDVDAWRNRLSCIGTCKLRFDNSANKYEGLFDPDDPIIISIVGTITWAGMMDDVRPYLPEKGVLTNELIMTGRDHGRYLVDNSFTKKYPTGWAADIVDDILSTLGDPLLYTDGGEYGGEAQIKYEGTRAKLGDALREICELSGRDFYIDNNGRLHLFEAGQVDSTVDLFLLTDDPTNNLLTFEEYEQIGTSIKNSIEIHAGSVKDHYSDGNSADLSVGGAGAVADSVTHIYGSQSIQFTCTDPATFFLEFDQNPVLADYGYSGSVDLSKLCEAKVMLRGTRTGKTVFSLRPFLVDGGGNKIVFCRVGPDATIGGKGGSKGWTENIVTWDHRAFWTQLSYPLGAHDSNPIKPGPGLTTGFWCADTGDITFDWTDVVDIGFEYPFTENAVILIDGWCIPSIEAKSIQQDAASQHPVTGYGKRMLSQFRKEMRSQKQIILYAKKVLALRKDPIQKFKGVAKGQVGTKYAAQSVDVEVTAYAIDAPYTITALHHKLHHGRDVRGWSFLTEYELAAQDSPATIILVDDNPLEVGMDRLALENRGYKGGMEAEDSLLGDIQSGRFTQETRGTPFALYPADGDLHWLTADLNDPGITGFQYYGVAAGILYTYDESTPKWVRAPCELGRRAGDPPAGAGGGEYTGDTYYNTTDSQFYQWTGAAWEAIASMDLGDLGGEVSATQLKKGIQPFDSSVLVEAIRVIATATVTFDVDVDNGAGGADITASVGTPFSNFTAGDELVIHHSEDRDSDTTARTVDTVNGGGSGITLDDPLAGVDNADDETMIVSVADGLKWTGASPAVWFADGTNQNIANGTIQGLAPGTYWVIFTVGGAVSLTSTYANAVGDTVGIIARVTIVFGREPFIFPIFTRGGSMTLDFLGAGVIDTILLTGDQIIGKDFRTAEDVGVGGGPAGVRWDPTGIYGYSGGATKTFALESATGLVTVYDTGSFQVRAADNTLVGYVGAFLNTHLNIYAAAGKGITIWSNFGIGGRGLLLDPGGAILMSGLTLQLVGTNGIFMSDDVLVHALAVEPDIGTLVKPFGSVFTTLVDVSTNLRIPTYNGADPVALVSGDLWLREDL